MTRPACRGTLVITAGVLLAACGSPGGRSAASSEIDRHADMAGVVMTRQRGPVPVGATANAVTGTSDDTTIDALSAIGSTWGGTVVLRITVDRGGGTVADVDRASRCFAYRFHFPRTPDDGQPRRLTCPAGAPLDLDAVRYPAGVDSTTAAKARSVLERLSRADRVVPARVVAALRAGVGPYFTVTAGAQAPGVFAWVRYGTTCLSAQTSTASVQVSPTRHGDDCFGG